MKKIITCVTILIFVACTILIGTPLGENTYIVNLLIGILAILSLINNRKEKQLKLNLEDILLILICVSSIIPVILKTYVSLNNSVEYILRYTSVLLIYFVIRKEIKNNPKLEGYIINTVIISAVFLIICGIDLITTKKLEYLTNLIVGDSHIFTYEIRMSSLFMYPNTFAIYISIALFLLLGKIEKTENLKINSIYLSIIMWMFVSVISSESRLGIVSLFIVMIIYLIIDRKNILTNLRNILINGILAIIFSAILFKLISLGMYIQIWALSIVYTIIVAVINYLIQKIKLEKIHINLKIILAIIVVAIVLLVVLLHIKGEFVIFKGENAQTFIRKKVCLVNGGETYSIKLDLEAKSEIEDNYTITIIEENKNGKEIKETSITIDNFSGIKEFNIQMQEATIEFFIYFNCKQSNENTYLKVKSVYVNDEEKIINYKFLPTELVTKILTSNFSTKNFSERVYFLKCAIIGGIDNKLLGIGGGGWQYIHSKYQEYDSPNTEIHSYIGQLTAELGILGIASYIALIIILIINCIKYIKNKDRKINSLMCAILVVVIHSILDFEMSYFLVMLVTYSLIAILVTKTNENEKIQINNKIAIIFAIIILLPSMITNSKAVYSQIYLEPKMLQTSSYSEKIKMQAENVSLNPYKSSYLRAYIKTWQIYVKNIDNISKEDDMEFLIKINNILEKLYKNEPYTQDSEMFEILKTNTIKLIKYGEEENTNRYIELIYKIYSNTGITNKYRANLLIEKISSISEFINKLETLNKPQIAEKFTNLLNEKIEETKKQIKEYEKCEITKEESEGYLEVLNYKEV